MAVWLRLLWVAMILVMPGGFALFTLFVLGRAVRLQYGELKASGAPGAPVYAALSRVRWRDVVRQARSAL
jgi:hypothetical protein